MRINQLRFVDYGAVLSEKEDGRIIWHNRAAEAIIGRSVSGDGIENGSIYELFEDVPEFSKLYSEMDFEGYMPDLSIMSDGKKARKLLFMSICFRKHGRELRLDLFEVMDSATDGSDAVHSVESAGNLLKTLSWQQGVSGADVKQFVMKMLDIIIEYYRADDALIIHVDTELNVLDYTYRGVFQRSTLKIGRRFSGYWKPLLRVAGSEFYDLSRQKAIPMLSHLEDIKGRNDRNFMFAAFHDMTDRVMIIENIDNNSQSGLMLDYFRVGVEYIFDSLAVADIKPDLRNLGPNDIYLQMSGGFCIHSSKGSLSGTEINSPKCCNMLIYLAHYRSRTVSVRELSESLWPNELLDDPYNLIKGTAFRARKAFAGICDRNLIVANKGSYMVNPELNFITDFDLIGNLYQNFRTVNYHSKMAIAETMLEKLGGRLLPEYEGEYWLIPIVNKYENCFRYVILEYIKILENLGDYKKITDVVSRTLEIMRMDDELHYYMIVALFMQSKYDMAHSYYAKVRRFLGDDKRKKIENLWRKRFGNDEINEEM